MDEIDVMEGLDFKLNQKREREKIKIRKMKCRRKKIIITIILGIMLICFFYLNKKKAEQRIINCQKMGNDINYSISPCNINYI